MLFSILMQHLAQNAGTHSSFALHTCDDRFISSVHLAQELSAEYVEDEGQLGGPPYGFNYVQTMEAEFHALSSAAAAALQVLVRGGVQHCIIK